MNNDKNNSKLKRKSIKYGAIKVLKIVVKLIIFLIIVSLLFRIDEKLATIAVLFTSYYYFLMFLVWVRDKLNKSEIKNRIKSVRKSREKHDEMFTWLGEEIDTDKIMYDLIGDELENADSFETITKFKQLIEGKIGENLTDYYLVREFIKSGISFNFNEFLKNSFGPIAISLLLGLTSLSLNKISIPQINFSLTNELISWVFTSLSILFLILTFISIIYNTFIKPKRRAKLFISVLDIIIKEKELKKEDK